MPFTDQDKSTLKKNLKDLKDSQEEKSKRFLKDFQ